MGGDVDYGKIYDIYFPPQYLRLFDGPSCCVIDMWRILGRGTTGGGLVVGTIIKPKLGLQPKPFGEACYGFWQGGDFIFVNGDIFPGMFVSTQNQARFQLDYSFGQN